jgi:hypothetical protein
LLYSFELFGRFALSKSGISVAKNGLVGFRWIITIFG